MNVAISNWRFRRLNHERRNQNLRQAILTLMTFAALAATTQSAVADRKVSIASHIPDSPASGQHVVSVISQTDIELSGMRNVGELLLDRAVYNSFGIHRPQVVGSGRTAIFINGRRISDSTLELRTLPVSAVEYIEVLSDSVTGLHGGHAVGGAINIVLKRDYTGFEIQASVSPTEQAGGDSGQASLLWGGPLGDGRLTLGADFFQRDEIRDKHRVYSRATWTPGGSFADTSGVSEGGNTLYVTIGDKTNAYPLGPARAVHTPAHLRIREAFPAQAAALAIPRLRGTPSVMTAKACLPISIIRLEKTWTCTWMSGPPKVTTNFATHPR